MKAFKDFTLAGPFLLHFREVIKVRQERWIKFWKHSSFVFFQFNYSNHQSGNSILIVFFFNRFFWCLIIYLLTLNIFSTRPKKTKVLFFLVWKLINVYAALVGHRKTLTELTCKSASMLLLPFARQTYVYVWCTMIVIRKYGSFKYMFSIACFVWQHVVVQSCTWHLWLARQRSVYLELHTPLLQHYFNAKISHGSQNKQKS